MHQEAEQIMVERFGGDAVLALSTAVKCPTKNGHGGGSFWAADVS